MALPGSLLTIALDARIVGYAAGISRYAVELSRALVGLEDRAERYTLLQGRRARGAIARGSGVTIKRCLTPPHHRLERWALPLELLASGPVPRLLHSVDHVSPAWGPWKSVVTIHDLAFALFPETHTEPSRRYYAHTAESCRRAERVIAVSRATAHDLTHVLQLDPSRIDVIYEAPARSCFPRPREAFEVLAREVGIVADRPYVLFVGTLEPRKNLPLLFDAMVRVRREIDAQLVVVGGPGWLQEPILEAHEKSGLGAHARFLGWQGEERTAVLYSHAAALALPSVYEGFGLPVVEAMACGAPVVSSNAGPLPEIAGDAAVLLDPHDAAAWVGALLKVLSEPAHAAALRERGFKRAAQFSWERCARETRDVYRRVLDG